MGFVSALSEMDISQHENSLALLRFNVGVKVEQATFVAAILLLIFVLKNHLGIGLLGAIIYPPMVWGA